VVFSSESRYNSWMGRSEEADSLQLSGFPMSRTYKERPFLCKQKDKEPLQNYFRRFVHPRAQAPNMLDAVAINTAIVGLRAG
jgi:hypothetical protein